MTIHEFKTTPSLGTLLIYDNQSYRLKHIKPYRKIRNGEKTFLLVWETPCAKCKIPFETTTPLKIKSFNRRCKKHTAPGKRVNPSRYKSSWRKK